MANTNQTHTVRRQIKAVARKARPTDVPDLLGIFAQVIEDTVGDQEQKREIGRRMKRLRERSPHTQESLADLLEMTVRGYQKAEETGSIRYTRLEKLADIHRVPIDYFCEREAVNGNGDGQQLDRIEKALADLREQVEWLTRRAREEDLHSLEEELGDAAERDDPPAESSEEEPGAQDG